MKKRIVMFLAAAMAAICAPAEEWTDPDTGYTWTYETVSDDTVGIYGISPAPTGALTIPSQLGGKTVTSITTGVFRDYSGLTSVTIPDGVTSIAMDAFYGCSGLTSVSIPDSVTSIEDYAFCNCASLTSVTIPNTVTSIGKFAFYGCSGLTSVTLGNSVTSIGVYAFSYCSSLTSMTIPDSMTGIAAHAFFDCTNLTSVTIPQCACESFQDIFTGSTLIQNVVISDGVTSIRDHAFSDCTNLTSVTIPNSVTKIGSGAFASCRNLTSVTIPDSVTNIVRSAFAGCTSLTSVTIPASVTGIEDYAFFWTGLTSVTIPASVTSIGEHAFHNCADLTSVTIPDSVTDIWEYAFSGCSGLTNVTIPNGVTIIRERAFSYCSGLTSVTIPSSVTDIRNYAFNNCTNLTSVTIPDSVTSIGDEAFSDCSSLTRVEFEGNAPSFGYDAFLGVGSGCTVYVKEGSTGWDVTIPGKWSGPYTAFERRLNIQYLGNDLTPDPEPVPQQVWTVTFNANGGVGDMVAQIFANGMAQMLNANTFTRFGYDFAGWATSADGEVVYADGQRIAVTSGQTLYAQWREGVAGRLDTGFATAQTVLGALYGRDGVPVGTVQVKVGKINAKKGTVKISASATLLVDGKAKKVAAKAVTVEIAAGTAAPHAAVAMAFKAPIGEMAFEMEVDGTFKLKNNSYVMAEKKVGGSWTRAGAGVYLDGGRGATALPAGTIEELLPDGEPVIPKAGKWSFAKAAGVKYAKDKATGEFNLVIDDTKGTNRSAMKLTYTPKTGIFKGSFKIYAIQGGKLKKVTVKVIGVVVDGKGWGSATGPGGVSFAVTVE